MATMWVSCDRPCTRIWSLDGFRLSIEWAKLEMVGGMRRIYGGIHVNNGCMSRAVTVYSRSSDQLEEVRSQGYLSLCGPRYSLQIGYPGFLYVDLREEGGAPFLRQKVPLSLDNKLKVNESFTVKADADGDRGRVTLTISMTPIMPSVLARVCVKLMNVDCSEDWLVSGSVEAIQTLSGCPEKRVVTLFRRPKSDPISLAEVPVLRWGPPYDCPTLTRNIPLDRDVVVAPVYFGDTLLSKVRDLALEGYNEDPNGAGSSLAISVNLKFVYAANHKIRSCVKGSPEFELEGSHNLGGLYYQYVEAPIKNKDKDNASSGSSPSTKNLKVIAFVTSFSDFFDTQQDEPYECDLPLNLDS